MPKIARLGDPCTHGAVVYEGSNTRMVDGQPVARLGDRVNCPQHGLKPIITVDSGMPLLDGQPVAHVGAIAQCGARIIDGSPTTYVGNGSTIAEETDVGVVEYQADEIETTQNDDVDDAPSPPQTGGGGGQPPTDGVGSPVATVPPGPIATSCRDIPLDPPDNLRLSPNFTIQDVTSGAILSRYPLTAQMGLTKQEIACNLRAVCINILEPLVTHLGGREKITITSGLRAPSTSKHSKGFAVDIQVLSYGYTSAALDLAYWITQDSGIAFDALIYEMHGRAAPVFHCQYMPSPRQQVLCGYAPYRTGLPNRA